MLYAFFLCFILTSSKYLWCHTHSSHQKLSLSQFCVQVMEEIMHTCGLQWSRLGGVGEGGLTGKVPMKK